MDTTFQSRQVRLKDLAGEAEACRACALGNVRTQAVFGVGSATADVMFVGEAPGFYEDRQGEPFVGAAGQLLTKLIESKLGLRRPDVRIANVLRCRPPGNRDPLPGEVEACRPFLEKEIEVVDPNVIVALGNFAAQLLLGTSTGISRLRGKRYRYGSRTLVPAFHPAAALRGGAAVAGIEQDFELVRQVLAEPKPVARDDASSEQLGLF